MTAYEKETLDTLKKSGVKITQPDQATFREVVKDLYRKYEGKLWPEGFVDKIRAAENN